MELPSHSTRRRFLYTSAGALAATALLIGTTLESAANDPTVKPFDVRNAMRFVNMPDTSSLGLRSVPIVYSGAIWRKNASKIEPDVNFITKNALPTLQHSNPDLVIIDIEHWHLSDLSAPEIDRNIDRYVTVIDTFRRYLPDAKLGLYGMIPIRNYWAPVKNDKSALSQWRIANQRLQRLAAAVDVIFPSLYTFYDDPLGWKTYAIANISEARQYDKPVYAFLWPQFHRSRRPIAADFWRLQLQTVYEEADGLVIWSPAKGRPRWDPDAPWWLQTVDFLQTIELAR